VRAFLSRFLSRRFNGTDIMSLNENLNTYARNNNTSAREPVERAATALSRPRAALQYIFQ